MSLTRRLDRPLPPEDKPLNFCSKIPCLEHSLDSLHNKLAQNTRHCLRRISTSTGNAEVSAASQHLLRANSKYYWPCPSLFSTADSNTEADGSVLCNASHVCWQVPAGLPSGRGGLMICQYPEATYTAIASGGR